MLRRGNLKSVILLITMLLLLAACTSSSGNDNNTGISSVLNETESTGSSTETEEIVTLRLLITETGSKWNLYSDSAVVQEIADKVGVKIEYVETDDSKFSAMLAGGALPDIVRVEPAKHGKQLIESNLIIPMDDMLEEYGQDILQNIPNVVEFSRENWSGDMNQVYFLPPQVQSEPNQVYTALTIGPTIRWDYYKEIGAPEFNNPLELLDILEQIVAKYPQTEDGNKIYGVSMWQDWGLWPYIFPFTWFTTQSTNNSDLMARNLGETQYRNILIEEDSTYWVAVNFYNEAYRRNLLDPDALTMKYNDYLAKATAGQIVLGPAIWAMGDFNSKYASEGKGFIVLPVGKRSWSGGVNLIGWPGKSYAIFKSSKYPEKAMQFLNYIYSYEGARTMYSGVEGVHWEFIDGKPQIKEETFALKNEGSTEWAEIGIALDTNLIGLGGGVLDPETQAPLDLFMTQEALVKGTNALEKDFSNYYGGLHPGDVLDKLIAEGKIQDSNMMSQTLSLEQRMNEARVGLPVIPEDMKKIEEQLKELAARYATRLILATTDEEFAKIKAEALQAFEEGGAHEFSKFYTDDYAERRRVSQALPAEFHD